MTLSGYGGIYEKCHFCPAVANKCVTFNMPARLLFTIYSNFIFTHCACRRQFQFLFELYSEQVLIKMQLVPTQWFWEPDVSWSLVGAWLFYGYFGYNLPITFPTGFFMDLLKVMLSNVIVQRTLNIRNMFAWLMLMLINSHLSDLWVQNSSSKLSWQCY